MGDAIAPLGLGLWREGREVDGDVLVAVARVLVVKPLLEALNHLPVEHSRGGERIDASQCESRERVRIRGRMERGV